MSAKLLGMSGAIKEPVEAVGSVLDNLFTSKEETLTLEIAKERLAAKPALIQAEINKVQASHRSMFVAGARPFLMWVCGVGFAYAFIIEPMLSWILPTADKPELPLDVMMELTVAMLGLSSLRTVEKLTNKSKQEVNMEQLKSMWNSLNKKTKMIAIAAVCIIVIALMTSA